MNIWERDEGTLLRQNSSWSPNEAGNEDFNYKACPAGWKQGKMKIKVGGLMINNYNSPKRKHSTQSVISLHVVIILK